MKIINEFHNTEIEVRNPDTLHSDLYAANHGNKRAKRRIARIRKELCGMEDCTCGGSLGERPSIDSQIHKHFSA